MPPGHKLRRGETKCVLKRALRGLLPDRIVRRRKMGFPIPLELMFRGDLFDYASDLLLSRRALERGYFKGSEVERLLKQHRTGGAAHHREIWQLLVLEEWHRSFGY
jgi:asparagine synthase (glutamine-hydrolysing)